MDRETIPARMSSKLRTMLGVIVGAGLLFVASVALTLLSIGVRSLKDAQVALGDGHVQFFVGRNGLIGLLLGALLGGLTQWRCTTNKPIDGDKD